MLGAKIGKQLSWLAKFVCLMSFPGPRKCLSLTIMQAGIEGPGRLSLQTWSSAGTNYLAVAVQ